MERALLLKKMYNNVFTQAISDSGKHLFIGNEFGDIFVLKIEDLEETDKPCSKLKVYSQGENNKVYSLAYHRDFLIVGSAGGTIYGLQWFEEKGKLSDKRSWEIKIPIDIASTEVPEVNFMWLCKEQSALFAGCGDNKIYEISLEDGQIKRAYEGHTDYIHGVVGTSTGRLYSASEDGTVKCWSSNQKDATASIEPSKHEKLARPEFGKFIGAVAINDDDWLLCGGGPKTSLWHIRSMECSNTYPFPGKVHVLDVVQDEIFVAGEHPNACLYSLNNDVLAEIQVEPTAVYSMVWQEKPVKFMSIAGSHNALHILKDFRFLDSKIELYGNTDDFN